MNKGPRQASSWAVMFGAVVMAGPVTPPPLRPVSSHAAKLQLEEFTGDSTGFNSNATLVLGPTEAVLVDALFLVKDANRIADRIAASGRHLKAILLTHPDDDHYYGVATILQRFPGTPVYLSPAGIEEFTSRELPQFKRGKEGSFVNYQSGRRPPLLPDSLIVPQPFPSGRITVDGEEIQVVVDQQGDVLKPSNNFFWIPSIRTVISGDIVFNGVHVWLAASNEASRAAWQQSLKRIADLHPERVVAGHKSRVDAPDTPDAVQATSTYLVDFDAAKKDATKAQDLMAAMDRKYSQLAVHLILRAAAGRAFPPPPPPPATSAPTQVRLDVGMVRDTLARVNEIWGKARVAADRAVLESMVLPEARLQLLDGPVSRPDFIDQLCIAPAHVKFLRLDPTVLTLHAEPNGEWTAVVQEKMEWAATRDDGTTVKTYALWVTQYAWKHVGDTWMIAASTVLSTQWWNNRLPPIVGW